MTKIGMLSTYSNTVTVQHNTDELKHVKTEFVMLITVISALMQRADRYLNIIPDCML